MLECLDPLAGCFRESTCFMECRDMHFTENISMPIMHVMRPSGVLPQYEASHIIFECWRMNGECPDFRFPRSLFYLHKKLRLNVTFDHIRLSDTGCNKPLSPIIVASIFQRSSTRRLKYCGTLPKINVFPVSPIVLVYVLFAQYVFVKTNISFCIIDSSKVSTEANNRWFNPYVQGICTFKFIYFIYTIYHIRANKDKVVHLVVGRKLDFRKVKVHDGPAIKCKLLVSSLHEGRGYVYKGSTFQVSVHMVTLWNENTIQFRYNFTSQNKCVVSVSNNSSQQLLLPNKSVCAVINHCVLAFVTEDNSNVTLHIGNFSGRGTTSKECDFSGIVLMNKVDGQYKETYEECVRELYGNMFSSNRLFSSRANHHPDHVFNLSDYEYTFPGHHDSRTLHSQKNNFLLVYFFYHEYDSLTVTVNVTTLQCEVIRMDTCEASIRSVSQQHSDLKLLGYSIESVDLAWKIPSGRCIILQIETQVPRNCSQIVLNMFLTSSWLSFVNMTVTGLLTGNFSLSRKQLF